MARYSSTGRREALGVDVDAGRDVEGHGLRRVHRADAASRRPTSCRWRLVPWTPWHSRQRFPAALRTRTCRWRTPSSARSGRSRARAAASRWSARTSPRATSRRPSTSWSAGSRGGEQDVVLLGATGTGKSATTAWLIERLQRPTLVMAPNKTLAAQLANELREMLPNNAVEYFVSYYDYYQPEAYIAQTDTYIEKDSSINEDVERLRHSATMNLLSRRDVVVVASVSCIYGLGTPAVLPRPVGQARGRRQRRARRAAARAGRRAVHPQRHGVQPRHVPGPRRHGGDHPGLRGARAPHRVLRRRDRGAVLPAPAHRRRRPAGRRAADLPGHALRRRPGADGARRPRHRGRAGGAAGRAGAARASCWRRSGCGCAPSTTWR